MSHSQHRKSLKSIAAIANLIYLKTLFCLVVVLQIDLFGFQKTIFHRASDKTLKSFQPGMDI